jgi:hypothetical protein
MDINKLLSEVEVQQKEMHKFIDEYSALLKEKMPDTFAKKTYQDVMNIYFLFKLVELQQEVNYLKTQRNGSII